MKNRFHNQIQILNYITSTDRFKLLFGIGIIIAIYASFVLSASTDNFIDSVFMAFQFNIFNVILFALLFFNTQNTCVVFENQFSFYIVRLKNKKNYIKEVVKNIIICNLFYLFIFFLFYFSFLLLLKNDFSVHSYMSYNISNLIYLIYYIIYYIILLIGVTILSGFVYMNFKTTITFCFDGMFLFGFMLGNVKLYSKDYYDFIFWNHFSPEVFSTLSLDITSIIGVILLVQIMIMVGYYFTLKNQRMVIT